jgi:hypothetical protein
MSTGTAPSTWDQMTFDSMMNMEAKDRRAGRKAFLPDAPGKQYVKSVDNYVITSAPNVLSVGSGLQPMMVRASVSVSVDAQDDPGLRAFAARQLGDAFCYAEDAIVLLGKNAPALISRGAVTLTIDPAVQRQQIGLFNLNPKKPQGKVAKGTIIASVVKALNRLRAKGHHGPFVVIVDTELNEEAWTQTQQGLLMAPINAVLPELRSPEDGWIWSDVIGSREGVAISLGGESFDFIVSYDPHVESAIVTTQTFDIGAALQFRLRINDLSAIEELQ